MRCACRIPADPNVYCPNDAERGSTLCASCKDHSHELGCECNACQLQPCCDSNDYAGHVCLSCGYQHCHCPGGTPGPGTGPLATM